MNTNNKTVDERPYELIDLEFRLEAYAVSPMNCEITEVEGGFCVKVGTPGNMQDVYDPEGWDPELGFYPSLARRDLKKRGYTCNNGVWRMT